MQRQAFLILLAGVLAAGCTPQPDFAAITAERAKPVQRYDIAQAIAANGKVTVAGTQSGAALVSTDSGRSWTRRQLGAASLIGIVACPDGTFVAIDYYRKVWAADPRGEQWKPIELKAPHIPLAVTCDHAGGWWVGGTGGVIAGSRDQGRTWAVTDLGEDAQFTAIQFTDAEHGVAVGEFGLTAYTQDGGATWVRGAKLPNEFYPYAALFTSRDEGWVSGLAGQVLHTADGGKTWHKQANESQAALYRLFMYHGVPHGAGAGGVVAGLDGDTWRSLPYRDAVPAFLGGAAATSDAVVIGGPGGLLRTVDFEGTKQESRHGQ